MAQALLPRDARRTARRPCARLRNEARFPDTALADDKHGRAAFARRACALGEKCQLRLSPDKSAAGCMDHCLTFGTRGRGDDAEKAKRPPALSGYGVEQARTE